jgi:hypothetical protein
MRCPAPLLLLAGLALLDAVAAVSGVYGGGRAQLVEAADGTVAGRWLVSPQDDGLAPLLADRIAPADRLAAKMSREVQD